MTSSTPVVASIEVSSLALSMSFGVLQFFLYLMFLVVLSMLLSLVGVIFLSDVPAVAWSPGV
jgi:hypothetical protein